MKSVFVIDDNGQGMEEVRAFLRERGYGVSEYGEDYDEKLRFTQFAVERACVQIFWLTKDRRILYVNDETCRSLGYTREELMRMSLSDIDPWYFGLNGIELSEM